MRSVNFILAWQVEWVRLVRQAVSAIQVSVSRMMAFRIALSNAAHALKVTRVRRCPVDSKSVSGRDFQVKEKPALTFVMRDSTALTELVTKLVSQVLLMSVRLDVPVSRSTLTTTSDSVLRKQGPTMNAFLKGSVHRTISV